LNLRDRRQRLTRRGERAHCAKPRVLAACNGGAFSSLCGRDQRDLLNRKARFEEAACAFVPEVVKVKVFDFEVTALAPKRRSDRLSIVGEYPTAVSTDATSLLLDDSAGVVARDI
jgi:hypothetical protein